MLASSPLSLVEDLFGSGIDDFKKYGVYTCRFYKNGQWVDVICDTRIPCIDKKPIYSSSRDPNEVFVQFLEKAYAKLHGTYESLNRGSIAEALVDLTGGSCDKINLSSEKIMASISKGHLWDELISFCTKGYVVGCSISQNAGGTDPTPESLGLFRNLAYPLIECREVEASTGMIRMVKFRNPWGEESSWQGDWGTNSNNWDDYPEVYSELRGSGAPGGGVVGEEVDDEEEADGDSFWMEFSDVCSMFTKMYVCRLFLDEQNWRQYCMCGDWVGKTAGGAPKVNKPEATTTSKLSTKMMERRGSVQMPRIDSTDKLESSDVETDEGPGSRRNSIASLGEEVSADSLAAGLARQTMVLPESDAYWFNNPQFQIRCQSKSKVHISLMQQDRRIRSQLRENYPIAFEIVRQKRIIADLNMEHPRVWELEGGDVNVDSTKTLYVSHLPQREVSVDSIELEPTFVYNIIPHPSQRLREGKFFLRVFADSDLTIEQIGETNSLYLPGSWDRVSERDTSGGPLKIFDEKAKKVKDNARWCQNPQFLLTTTKPRTAYDDDEPGAVKSIDIKIVVRRTDSGASRKVRGKRDERRKSSVGTGTSTPDMLGMVICRAPMSEKDSKLAAQRRRQADSKVNALGQRLPTKESSLKARRKKMALLAAREAEAEKSEGRGNFDEDGEGVDELGGSMGGRKSDKIGGTVTERKMTISREEWSICTDYTNSDVTSIFMKKVDMDTLSDGLLIIPSLSRRGVKGGFTLEIHSDFPVKVEELPETRSRTITGEWTESTSGGSHLNPDWKKNPKFNLKLNSNEPANVKIVLSRNEKTWSKECTKDSIGSMMGFYLMQGSKPNRDLGNITHDGRPWGESAFVPLHSVSTPEDFILNPLPEGEAYTIMPATFDSGKKGPFFLSVITDVDFSFTFAGKKDGKEGGGGRRVSRIGSGTGLDPALV